MNSNAYPLIRVMERDGIEVTLDNYLTFDRGALPQFLTGEEIEELPPQFREEAERRYTPEEEDPTLGPKRVAQFRAQNSSMLNRRGSTKTPALPKTAESQDPSHDSSD